MTHDVIMINPETHEATSTILQCLPKHHLLPSKRSLGALVDYSTATEFVADTHRLTLRKVHMEQHILNAYVPDGMQPESYLPIIKDHVREK